MGCLLILAILIVVLMGIIIGALALAVTGAASLILFGDVILCVIFIIWLIKKLRKR